MGKDYVSFSIFCQLFTHPAVHSEMNRKWHGRALEQCKPWQLNFLTVWCLFDLLVSPILLAVFSLRRNRTPGKTCILNSLLSRALTVLRVVAKQVLVALLLNKTARHCGNYSSTVKHFMTE